MKQKEVKDETATKLKKLFIERGEEIMKYLLELYEFQENITFINTKITNLNKNPQ